MLNRLEGAHAFYLSIFEELSTFGRLVISTIQRAPWPTHLAPAEVFPHAVTFAGIDLIAP
jgi:hypothetical protein